MAKATDKQPASQPDKHTYSMGLASQPKNKAAAASSSNMIRIPKWKKKQKLKDTDIIASDHLIASDIEAIADDL